jgi:hypothetical protein
MQLEGQTIESVLEQFVRELFPAVVDLKKES